eukprot:TRINITY_DN8722_c0_g1_i1.p1 TRINITY_DN8722_c0_g1~~TRINITY_DN8722_c0_g1_i1.p1  ORF type:complete len:359 (+),score=51.53 TRINITY_DN8722_c0_g1_i1:37-1113(+)
MAKKWHPSLMGDGIRYRNGGLDVQARPFGLATATVVGDAPYVYPHNMENQSAPVCYFEVTITKLPAEASFYIGFADSNVAPLLFLPGKTTNSFLLSHPGKLLKYKMESCEYGASFGQGDTVGAGIFFDSFNQRRFFFTLNGKMLKPTSDHFGTVAHGMEALPLVCVSGGFVDFSSNFTGTKEPWKAGEVVKQLLMRPHQDNFISSLPEEILKLTLSFAAETHHEAALLLTRVCQTWKKLSSTNDVWRPVYLRQWANQNPQLKFRDWKKSFQRRYAIFRDSSSSSFQIENCSFEFECPYDSRVLQASSVPNEKFCDKCKQTVAIVKTDRELVSAVALGKCVAVEHEKRKLRGKVKARRS